MNKTKIMDALSLIKMWKESSDKKYQKALSDGNYTLADKLYERLAVLEDCTYLIDGVIDSNGGI